MNIWLVLGAVAALVLVVVLVGTPRPRRAEDELGQPSVRVAGIDPARIDISSLDTRLELKLLLRTIARTRETGTLQLSAADRTGSLYFLFGHLFHAATGALTGEPAVQEMLSWPLATPSFDKTAPLPKEETIQRPIDQIVA